ncbi:hypothetical protein M408DRAFT_29780 [Serendipita vermifera MAFF 305830]|uniref:Uncharacterized protein n=1 Tax=Serendipita vermifera MAFF 305830 TaxID=933852 RepID=A0A0C3A975_SERVB|nr:hypothetical protein M408DRAFT_29780 [Serendipita vermifera MAFF 305830]
MGATELYGGGKLDIPNCTFNFSPEKRRILPYKPEVYGSLCSIYYQRNERRIRLKLVDTTCSDEDGNDLLRSLTYQGTDVVVLCYAIDAPWSLTSVREKWYPEVLHFLPGVPIILLGCKTDFGGDSLGIVIQPNDIVTQSQGRAVADEIGAINFVECSSAYPYTIDRFEEVLGGVAWSLSEEIATASSDRLTDGKCIIT